jgi:hypothetical protein
MRGRATVLRGGSWNNNPINLRATNRNNNTPDNRNTNIGFRCASESPFSGQDAGPSRRPATPGETPRPAPGRR